MPVDSYKYLPRSMRALYESMAAIDEPPVWAPLPKPVERCTIALMTSAGVFLKDSQQGFDEEREWREPTWGDPTYRVIPRDVRQEQIGCSHLHINHTDLLEDIDVVLPFRAFKALEGEGRIGKLADDAYSFMGYQDRRLEEWRTVQGPELVVRLKEQAVDVLLLAPA
ncbi:MAG: glycine/sarcosine/betaine reductase selenoprotein B family protein [Anaerolineaceae bacterium]